KSYRMTDINKNVLNPIVSELNHVFSDLKVNKIKAKKGRKIEKIEFTFTPEKRVNLKTQSQFNKNKKGKNRVKTPDWLDNPEKYRSHDNAELDPELLEKRKELMEKLKGKNKD